jgi:hypothetical protein
MPWSARFDDPIPLPSGGEIATLREAGDYIIALPEREHSLTHWQTAMRCLIEAAENDGIVMMAEIAMRRALFHDDRPKPTPQARQGAQDHPMTLPAPRRRAATHQGGGRGYRCTWG